MQHVWIRIVGFLACMGMVGVIAGCAGSTASTVGLEPEAVSVMLPEVDDVEEQVSEEPVVASSEPAQLEFEFQEPADEFTPIEDPVHAVVDPLEDPVVEPSPEPFLLDIPFNFDRSKLREDALMFLEVNAIRLNDESVDAVLLEGRGDEVGTADYNLVLGEQRARVVKKYLRDLGLDPSRLLITSYGNERPLCFEHNIECWQLNRSVRFVVE